MRLAGNCSPPFLHANIDNIVSEPEFECEAEVTNKPPQAAKRIQSCYVKFGHIYSHPIFIVFLFDAQFAKYKFIRF